MKHMEYKPYFEHSEMNEMTPVSEAQFMLLCDFSDKLREASAAVYKAREAAECNDLDVDPQVFLDLISDTNDELDWVCKVFNGVANERHEKERNEWMKTVREDPRFQKKEKK